MDIAKRRVCDTLYNMLQSMCCAIMHDDIGSIGSNISIIGGGGNGSMNNKSNTTMMTASENSKTINELLYKISHINIMRQSFNNKLNASYNIQLRSKIEATRLATKKCGQDVNTTTMESLLISNDRLKNNDINICIPSEESNPVSRFNILQTNIYTNCFEGYNRNIPCIKSSDKSSENEKRNNNNKEIKDGTNRNQMITNDNCSNTQKDNKYLQGTYVKIFGYKLGNAIEEEDNTTPFITKGITYSENVKQTNDHEDMKESITRK